MKPTHLDITAKPKDGFRRAGFRFGSESTRIAIKDLKKEQIEMLKGESNLVVHEVAVAEEKETPAANEDKKAGGKEKSGKK